MGTMNLSLPDPMKDWIETQARNGRYSDASAYVRDLIRQDQERADRIAALQCLIADGLESGISERSMTQVLSTARRQAGISQKP